MFGSKKKQQVSPPAINQHEDTIVQLKEELESLRQTVSAFPGAKQHWEAEQQNLKKEYEGKINSMKQELADKDNEVNIKVQASLAAIGANASFSPKQISSPSNTISSDNEKLRTFESLVNDEKTEYYRKHSVEIDRALKSL
jgi:hypothetical protein